MAYSDYWKIALWLVQEERRGVPEAGGQQAA